MIPMPLHFPGVVRDTPQIRSMWGELINNRGGFVIYDNGVGAHELATIAAASVAEQADLPLVCLARLSETYHIEKYLENFECERFVFNREKFQMKEPPVLPENFVLSFSWSVMPKDKKAKVYRPMRAILNTALWRFITAHPHDLIRTVLDDKYPMFPSGARRSKEVIEEPALRPNEPRFVLARGVR